MEAVKLAVNHWMHNEANFDGIVEFGALLAGPLVVGTDGAPAESMWDAWNCFDYDRPWIEADEHGMLAVPLLRRIAYTCSRSSGR
jgi:hypothetical protein